MRLKIETPQRAQALQITNNGSEDLEAQVRIMRWTQVDGEDRLAPTDDVVVSPAILRVAPGKPQTVRVVRLQEGPVSNEASYRVLVDELPRKPSSNEPTGITVLVRYSIPLFVQAASTQSKGPARPANLDQVQTQVIPGANGHESWRPVMQLTGACASVHPVETCGDTGRHFWLAWAAAGLMSAFHPGAAQAQSCYINSGLSMNFGLVTGSGRAASSSVNYTCAPDYSSARNTLYYQVCLFIGPGTSSTGTSPRRMTNYHGDYLYYDLFSDPVRSQPIGAPGSTPVYQILTAVAPGATVAVRAPLYGWVYAGQAVSAGGGSVSFSSSGVHAYYDNGCTVAASNLNFGRVTPPQAAVHETSRISVQCASGTPWRVALDNGLNFDGGMRRMAGAGGYVKYQLYKDESHTDVWGGEATDMREGATDANGTVASLTVYGEVPPQPEVQTGAYTDTVVVTLHY